MAKYIKVTEPFDALLELTTELAKKLETEGKEKVFNEKSAEFKEFQASKK